MNRHVSILALSAGFLASTLSIESVWAEVVEIERSDQNAEIETRSDAKDSAVVDQSDAERSGQDNVSLPPISDGEIELIIRLLGENYFGPTNDAEPTHDDDGYDMQVHQLADRIGKAYELGNDHKVLELLADAEQVRLARPEVNVFEAWSTYRTGSSVRALDLFETLYGDDPSVSNAVGAIYAGMRSERFTRVYEFAGKHGGPLQAILRPSKPHESGSEPSKVLSNYLNGWLAAAVKYDRDYTARKVAKLLNVDQSSSTNAAALNNLGWLAYRQGNFDYAERYFHRVESLSNATVQQRKDAVFGQALVLKGRGEEEAALDYIAPRRQQDVRLNGLYRDIALARGYRAFEAGDYSQSWEYAQQAVATDETSRQAQLLTAWSYLRLGEPEHAATMFETLYKANPDHESADGLSAALRALDREDEMAPTTNSVGEPLQVAGVDQTVTAEATPESIDQQDAPEETIAPFSPSGGDRAFYDKQFLLAAKRDPKTYGAFVETGFPWVGAGLRVQYRDGDQGLSQLLMVTDTLSFEDTVGVSHFSVELEVAQLDSGGDPETMAPVGSFVPDGFTPAPYDMTTEGTVLIPRLRWRREGDVAFEGSVGASPLDGEVSPTLTGHFDVTLHNDGSNYTLGVHRYSIYESILSLSGLEDPQTGESFGRVVETGAHGNAFIPLGDQWHIMGEARWGERTGHHVADNEALYLSAGVTFDLGLENFSYFSVGPNYRYEAFDENLSHFTLGHGGYYSPSSLHQFGVGSYFLTEEGKDWLVKGSGSVGYETAEQDEAPFFPLTPLASPDFYAAQSSSGAAFSAQAQGAWQLNDHWIAEAGAFGINASDYNEAGVFIKLRFVFGKRTGLRESDLTERLFRKYH